MDCESVHGGKTGRHLWWGGQKANPAAGNQHPRSADFQTNINDNNFFDHLVSAASACGNPDKKKPEKKKKKKKLLQYGFKSLFWPHNLFS